MRAMVICMLVGTLGSRVHRGVETQRSDAPVQRQSSSNLGIQGTHFTLNGKPIFLLGISYYGGLGASEESIRKDLDDMQRYGFHWLRVFATWGAFGQNVSAVDAEGRPREPFLATLKSLIAECDRRGLVVDVTVARGKDEGLLPSLEAHERAVETLVTALKDHRNWYLDLSNERDVGDDRHVPIEEVKKLCALVRRLDAKRLVTASFGGHDLSKDDLRDALLIAKLDFVTPHRPRDPESPAQTEAKTRECLAAMKSIGRVVPILYQEPLRRGYVQWQPTAKDFLTDLRGARSGGAAGWCFHNGGQRGVPDERPRRSFDLREKRLFDQLDEEERRFVSEEIHR